MGIDNLIIDGFDWGEGNLEKCQKHGVSISEIESIFAEEELTVFCDEEHSLEEERLIAVGQTKEKRNVLIIFTIRKRDKEQFIRPISARYMHQKEVKYYKEEIANLEE
ncbi:MAG: BrnT family toxin [Planctomycetes bacterium]|nr:BrnT family toxin [Planctomycetota bacterium]